MSKIGFAKQDGNNVEVYDENGSFKFNKYGELLHFTDSKVFIKENNGNNIMVYDENGCFLYEQH